MCYAMCAVVAVCAVLTDFDNGLWGFYTSDSHDEDPPQYDDFRTTEHDRGDRGI